jgi:hypothetical protein
VKARQGPVPVAPYWPGTHSQPGAAPQAGCRAPPHSQGCEGPLTPVRSKEATVVLMMETWHVNAPSCDALWLKRASTNVPSASAAGRQPPQVAATREFAILSGPYGLAPHAACDSEACTPAHLVHMLPQKLQP